MSEPGLIDPLSIRDAVPQRPQRTALVRGILWIMLSGLLFSVLNAGLRYVALDLPPLVTSFLRFCFGILFILPILWRHGLGVFRTRRPSLQVARNLVHTLAFAIWYSALPLIPLADMTALMFTGPLFVTLGAAVFLGETVRWRRWAAMVVGLIGVLVIVRPGFAQVTLGTLLMLSAMPVIAVSQLISKAQTRVDSTQTILCWQTLLLIVFFLPAALWTWQWPTLSQWLILAGCGVVGGAANYAMVKSFSLADISAVQPMTFLNIVSASVLGFLVFSDIPDLWTFVGAGIIVASTSYIGHREAQVARRAA